MTYMETMRKRLGDAERYAVKIETRGDDESGATHWLDASPDQVKRIMVILAEDDLTTEIVTTDRLEPGDLVLHYGMLIRLGAPHTYVGQYGRVWSFPGTVENMEEVYRPDHLTAGLLRADGRWAIQGNTLARWSRVI